MLKGEGKHFNAGMDLANFAPADKDGPKKDPARMRETFYHEVLELQDTFTALEECRMPTIASIQGACVGVELIWYLRVISGIVHQMLFLRLLKLILGLQRTLERCKDCLP